MRNLLQFVFRYHPVFLFVLLEALCFVLIFRYNRYQQTGIINSTTFASAAVYQRYNTIVDYMRLRSVNDSLRLENARLRQWLPNASMRNYVVLDTGSRMFQDSLKQVFVFGAAEVISNTVNRANNYLTLSVGSKHGIRSRMGVISPHGVVGIVEHVSPDFSTVISLLHPISQVSAKLKRQKNQGYVSWNGRNASVAQLFDIPNSVQIAIGDSVVTSGNSLIFPEGIPIGTVKEIRMKPGSTFFEIDIELATDFRRLEHVYVVYSLMQTQIDSLENLQLQE